MRIVPRASVRLNLSIAILVTVVLSWIISGGVANYLNYLGFRAFREEMMSRPGYDLRPIPEPRFGVLEWLVGRPPIPTGPLDPAAPLPPRPAPGVGPRPMGGGREVPPRLDPGLFRLRGLLLRLCVALSLALLAGALLGRKFTRPLTQLAKGAAAFQAGDFDYRIPETGTDEFAAVATAMNEMAAQVREHIDQLEHDVRRRRQLLADVAHELRSPVTTLMTMAAALQDGLADESARREFALSAMVTTSQRLGRLVQDLMDLARLEVTEMILSPREVDVRELVSTAIRSHEAEAAAAKIVMRPLRSGPPIRTVVDPDRIAQALDNLIENAISHAGEDAELSVSLEEHGDAICIVVSDTGRGIRASDLPYVLDPFYRSDSARTPGQSHSGLGLSIANKLIQAHGGSLAIDSKEGAGTALTILLPRSARTAP